MAIVLATNITFLVEGAMIVQFMSSLHKTIGREIFCVNNHTDGY